MREKSKNVCSIGQNLGRIRSNRKLNFDGFIGVDWSGAKGPNLPGLQVAIAEPGTKPPYLVRPPKGRWWSRHLFASWLLERLKCHRLLIGVDFAFGYPFADEGSFFPGLDFQLKTAPALWRLVEEYTEASSNFYGANFYKRKDVEFHRYYLSPYGKGNLYKFRQRLTEVVCSAVTSPHPVLKCIGAANVGTGSLAGMRVLRYLSAEIPEYLSVWPFNQSIESSCIVEVFPRLYFKLANKDPRSWKDIGNINETLVYYKSGKVTSKFEINTEDEADALVTAAALRFLYADEELWSAPKSFEPATQAEGWIFGVKEKGYNL